MSDETFLTFLQLHLWLLLQALSSLSEVGVVTHLSVGSWLKTTESASSIRPLKQVSNPLKLLCANDAAQAVLVVLREGDDRLAHIPSRCPILVHPSVSLSPSGSSLSASFYLFIYLSVPVYVSVEASLISYYTSPSTVSLPVTVVYHPISQKTVEVSY